MSFFLTKRMHGSDSRAQLPGSTSRLSHFLHMWPWKSHLTSQDLTFSICKMVTPIGHISLGQS